MLLCLQVNSPISTVTRRWFKRPRRGPPDCVNCFHLLGLRARHECNLFKYGLNTFVLLSDIRIKLLFDVWNVSLHPWGLEVTDQKRTMQLLDLVGSMLSPYWILNFPSSQDQQVLIILEYKNKPVSSPYGERFVCWPVAWHSNNTV